MMKKIKQNSGETLIETLVSMLIAVLCMGLLCSSVMAATNINKKTRELDDKYASDLQRAEGYMSEDGYDYKKKETVTLYGGAEEDSLFASYTLEEN